MAPAPKPKQKQKLKTFGRLDDRGHIDDSDLDVDISKRFKGEADSIFTKAFVNDAILIFREMKKRKQRKGGPGLPANIHGQARKLSVGMQSN
mmetsp:Transcript_38566/g.50552  ORF Transcript_38566/g.50552 Transcript_38566/m.50552 type:complete len:92 (-) Transcript_38566:490-765(-)